MAGQRWIWWTLGGLFGVCAVGTTFATLTFFRRVDYLPAEKELPAATKAAQEAGVPLTARELDPPRDVPANQDATPLIRSLEKEIRPARGETLRRIRDAANAGRWNAVETGLRPFAGVLTKTEQIAARPDANFKRDWDLGPYVLFPEFADLKLAAQLLEVRAVLRAHQGDVSGAMADLDRIRALAEHAYRDPVLIGLLVELAIRRIAIGGAEKVAAQWAKDDARLARIQAWAENEPPLPDFERAMRGEAFLMVSIARNLHAYGGERAVVGLSTDGRGPSRPPGTLLREGNPVDTTQRAFLVRHLQFWTEALPELRKLEGDPRAQAELMDRLTREYSSRPGRSYRLIQELVPVFVDSGEAVVALEASDRTLVELIRAMRTHARTGKWPTAAKEIDPFTGQALRIRRVANGIRVYSIGADDEDDGGKMARELPEGTRGRDADIVFGYPPVTR